jgi:HNH endonuclease
MPPSPAVVHRRPHHVGSVSPTGTVGGGQVATYGGHGGHRSDVGHANHCGRAGLAPGHAGQATANGGQATADDKGWPCADGRASPEGSGSGDGGLAARLHQAMALLPPPLGAPPQLLDLGRATRVVAPGLRRALAVRDGGCVVDGCDRPAPWTDAHHLVHWLVGGPTNVDNLVLLCRTHHRAVHEGSWQLTRDRGGQHTLSPPARPQALAPAT